MVACCVLILVLTFLTDCVATKISCPRRSVEIISGICLRVISTQGNPLNYSTASSICGEYKLGELRWHLPKTDTKKKNQAIVRHLESKLGSVNDKSYTTHFNEGNAYMWIDLRETSKIKNRREDENWIWLSDKTVLNTETDEDTKFWGEKQPDDDDSHCVIALVKPTEGALKFDDVHCADFEPQDHGHGFVGLVCEASLPEKESSIVDQWWFYLLCCSLVVLPIAAVAVVIGCRKKSPRRRRVKRKSSKNKKRRRRRRKSRRRRSRRHRRRESGSESDSDSISDELDYEWQRGGQERNKANDDRSERRRDNDNSVVYEKYSNEQGQRSDLEYETVPPPPKHETVKKTPKIIFFKIPIRILKTPIKNGQGQGKSPKGQIGEASASVHDYDNIEPSLRRVG